MFGLENQTKFGSVIERLDFGRSVGYPFTKLDRFI